MHQNGTNTGTKSKLLSGDKLLCSHAGKLSPKCGAEGSCLAPVSTVLEGGHQAALRAGRVPPLWLSDSRPRLPLFWPVGWVFWMLLEMELSEWVSVVFTRMLPKEPVAGPSLPAPYTCPCAAF